MRLSLGAPQGGNAVPAVVEDLTYQGAETRLALRSAGGTPLTLLVGSADLPGGIAPGADVWATWPQERGFFL
jgi:putative spermidine/putrescine transport system ATP-binding protein